MDEQELTGIFIIAVFLFFIVVIPLSYGYWEYKREWGYKSRFLDDIKTTYQKISSLIGFTDTKTAGKKDSPPGETGGFKGHWK